MAAKRNNKGEPIATIRGIDVFMTPDHQFTARIGAGWKIRESFRMIEKVIGKERGMQIVYRHPKTHKIVTVGVVKYSDRYGYTTVRGEREHIEVAYIYDETAYTQLLELQDGIDDLVDQQDAILHGLPLLNPNETTLVKKPNKRKSNGP